MDSERELLEWAAKAAGLDITWNPPGWPCPGYKTDTGETWDPRNHDANAMELLATLRANINYTGPYVRVRVFRQSLKAVSVRTNCKRNGGRQAATRLALFLAAAEFGRTMP